MGSFATTGGRLGCRRRTDEFLRAQGLRVPGRRTGRSRVRPHVLTMRVDIVTHWSFLTIRHDGYTQ